MLVFSLHLSIPLSLPPTLPIDARWRFLFLLPFLCSSPGSQAQAPGSRPASPQPIRLTRPVLKQTSAADILLEKPIEAGWVVLSVFLSLFIPLSSFTDAVLNISPGGQYEELTH